MIRSETHKPSEFRERSSETYSWCIKHAHASTTTKETRRRVQLLLYKQKHPPPEKTLSGLNTVANLCHHRQSSRILTPRLAWPLVGGRECPSPLLAICAVHTLPSIDGVCSSMDWFCRSLSASSPLHLRNWSFNLTDLDIIKSEWLGWFLEVSVPGSWRGTALEVSNECGIFVFCEL